MLSATAGLPGNAGPPLNTPGGVICLMAVILPLTLVLLWASGCYLLGGEVYQPNYNSSRDTARELIKLAVISTGYALWSVAWIAGYAATRRA